MNKNLPRCTCCHFAKYASQSDENLTIGEFVEKNWPNCACGKQCSDYKIFLTTMHRISHIPVKEYFCSGKNSEFRHKSWEKQRVKISRSRGIDHEFEDGEIFSQPKKRKTDNQTKRQCTDNQPKKHRTDNQTKRHETDNQTKRQRINNSIDEYGSYMYMMEIRQLSDEVKFLRMEVQTQKYLLSKLMGGNPQPPDFPPPHTQLHM